MATDNNAKLGYSKITNIKIKCVLSPYKEHSATIIMVQTSSFPATYIRKGVNSNT